MFFEQFYIMKWTIINPLNVRIKLYFNNKKLFYDQSFFGFRWSASPYFCTNYYIFLPLVEIYNILVLQITQWCAYRCNISGMMGKCKLHFSIRQHCWQNIRVICWSRQICTCQMSWICNFRHKFILRKSLGFNVVWSEDC